MADPLSHFSARRSRCTKRSAFILCQNVPWDVCYKMRYLFKLGDNPWLHTESLLLAGVLKIGQILQNFIFFKIFFKN